MTYLIYFKNQASQAHQTILNQQGINLNPQALPNYLLREVGGLFYPPPPLIQPILPPTPPLISFFISNKASTPNHPPITLDHLNMQKGGGGHLENIISYSGHETLMCQIK